jgi:hypothetical protein
MTLELPSTADDAAVGSLQRALLRAVKDKLQDALDDADLAAALVSNATLSVAKATRRGEGSAPPVFVYTLSVGLPTVLGAAPDKRRRALAGASDTSAALGNLLDSGYLQQRMAEQGVPDSDALFSSGSLVVVGGVVAPPMEGGVSVTLLLSGLPTSAVDPTSGKLTAAAVSIIDAALKKGIEGACPTCTVAVTRVADSAGRVVYTSVRRLQGGTYTVSYLIWGPAAAAAAASVNTGAVAAQLSGAAGFNTPITVALPSPAAAAAARAVEFSAAAALGVAVGALALLLLAAYGAHLRSSWERRKKLAAGDGGGGGATAAAPSPPPRAEPYGGVLQLREERPGSPLPDAYALSGLGEGGATPPSPATPTKIDIITSSPPRQALAAVAQPGIYADVDVDKCVAPCFTAPPVSPPQSQRADRFPPPPP